MITNAGLQKFFTPGVIDALEALSDPKRTIDMPLVRERAAGPFALERALFLSRGLRPDQSTADFTFQMPEGISFELRLVVKLVYTDASGDVVLGLISHKQWDEFPKFTRGIVGVDKRWVLVRYSIAAKNQGLVFMSNEVYTLTRVARQDALLADRTAWEIQKRRLNGR